MSKLDGEVKTYVANDSVQAAEGVELTINERRSLHQKFTDGKTFRVSPTLELKIGCQVMLLMNQQDQPLLVNGSRGVVIAFEQKDDVARDLRKKLKNLDTMTLRGHETPEERQNEIQRIQKQLDDLLARQVGEKYPVIHFQMGLKRTFLPAEFTYRVYGVGQAVREQIPLMLAWAISIHKSQGMSIDKLNISVKQSFANGQAYVAMSRATSKKGLEIRTWKDSAIKCSPVALKFDTTGEVDETWQVAAERLWESQLAEALRLADIECPDCKCGNGKKSALKTSNSANNPGRHFFTCKVHYQNPNSCKFFAWVDEHI